MLYPDDPGGGSRGTAQPDMVGRVRADTVQLLECAMRAAVRGGEVVLQHRRGSLAVRRKADDTPATLADEAA